jgi:opacity protein-like surface antigen
VAATKPAATKEGTMKTTEKNMNTSKIKILAGATALAAIITPASLFAQNSAPKGYFEIDLGPAWQSDITLRDSAGTRAITSFDTGFRLDFKGGVACGENWAFELETGVIYNAVDKIDGASLDPGDRLEFAEIPLLLNVIYKLPFRGPLTAYVGAGVGGVVGTYYAESSGFSSYTSDLTFGYQAMAGVRYALNDRWDIGVAYKFLGTSEHEWDADVKSNGTRTHSVLATVSYRF